MRTCCKFVTQEKECRLYSGNEVNDHNCFGSTLDARCVNDFLITVMVVLPNENVQFETKDNEIPYTHRYVSIFVCFIR